MVIGAYVIRFFREFLAGVVILVVMGLVIWYFMRLVFWILKFFIKDQINYIEGELRRMWQDRPFQKRPRREYLPTSFEEEIERRAMYKAQQILINSRRMDRPPNQDDDEEPPA